MDYNREHLTDLLARTRLTNSDFARLMGVSRVTVHNWLTSGGPHKLIQRRLELTIAAIESAATAGALPIVERGLRERQKQLVQIVRDHARK